MPLVPDDGLRLPDEGPPSETWKPTWENIVSDWLSLPIWQAITPGRRQILVASCSMKSGPLGWRLSLGTAILAEVPLNADDPRGEHVREQLVAKYCPNGRLITRRSPQNVPQFFTDRGWVDAQ